MLPPYRNAIFPELLLSGNINLHAVASIKGVFLASSTLAISSFPTPIDKKDALLKKWNCTCDGNHITMPIFFEEH